LQIALEEIITGASVAFFIDAKEEIQNLRKKIGKSYSVGVDERLPKVCWVWLR
jgi:hypothetical protein